MLSYVALMVGLAVLSAVLAWFALKKVPPPSTGVPGDRRGWQLLAARHDLRADLDGPVQQWRMEGEVDGVPVRVRVVEVNGERWTEARARVAGLPADVNVQARARSARGAEPLGIAMVDEVLAASGTVEPLAERLATGGCVDTWLSLLGDAEGPVVDAGWFTQAMDGDNGDALDALLHRVVEGARQLAC